jgi:hypothetical protein
LAEFLGQDLGGGVGVKKTMADDQLKDLVGAAVLGFGAALLVEQASGAELLEGLAKLEIALLAEAELGGGGEGAEAFAFALVKHSEFEQERIVARYWEGPLGAVKEEGVGKDFEHGGGG